MAIVDLQQGSFTVPAGAGSYAPERIWIGHGDKQLRGLTIGRIMADVSAAVATAVLELWVFQDGGTDRSTDAGYVFHSVIANGAAVGGQSLDVATPCAQLRAKSGGTAGTLTATATAFSYRDP